MQQVLGIKDTIHFTARRQRVWHPDYFLWGFVRHPCDRVLSAYYYECRKENRTSTFDGLAAYVRSPSKKTHVLPQVHFTHERDQLLLDFVGRFESLAQDFKFVCRRLAIDTVALPQLNMTVHPPWHQVFTMDMIKHAERNFAADFECFGYDPHTPRLPAPSARGQ